MKWKPLALAALAAVVSPIQLTVAELQDKVDESKVTAFQPDLVIGAWGGWVVICIMLVAGSKAVDDAKQAKSLAESLETKMNNQP